MFSSQCLCHLTPNRTLQSVDEWAEPVKDRIDPETTDLCTTLARR